MKRRVQGGALLLLLTMTAACSTERDPSDFFAPQDVDVLVIDAVLIVGQTHPLVRLSRTLAPDVPYTQDGAAVVGANLAIGSAAQSVSYTDLPGGPGYYEPTGVPHTIEPETEYQLYVETTQGEVLTARTMTPANFRVDSWVLLDPSGTTELRQLETFADAGDSVYYRPANQVAYAEGLIEARFAAGGAVNFAAGGYQLSLFSIDLDSDYVIDPPFFDDEDFEDLSRSGSSPALIAEDGFVRLPWFGIYFEGRHLYKVFTVDLNWFDLVRSTPQTDGGLGFGGNAGDGSNRPIFNVDGGIGLFGSASADSVGFYITPQE